MAQTVVVIVVVVVVICRAILHLSRLLHENYKTTGNRFLRRQPLWHDTQRVRSGEDERVLAHAKGSKIVSPIVDDSGRERGETRGACKAVSSWHDACAAASAKRAEFMINDCAHTPQAAAALQ